MLALDIYSFAELLLALLGERNSYGRKLELMDFFRKTTILWLALAFIAIGFLSLNAGKLSLGPLLLVGGYCVLLPFFIWRSFRKSVGE